jgi:glycerophosphoryl diester phosphodiesterase
MEIDLQVRADGGFAVLHDDDLSGETTGHGPVAQATAQDLGGLRLLRLGRAPMTSEELAGMLGQAHPAAVLQFDMKNGLAEVGPAGIAHLATHVADKAAGLIVSGASEPLIAALAQAIPGLRKGYDPTDELIALEAAAAVERRLLACLPHPVKPDMVYLQWEFLLWMAGKGLDMVALAQAEGVAVDAWTHAMADPGAGFSGAEWDRFAALLALGPDQITTDAPLATEQAFLARIS